MVHALIQFFHLLPTYIRTRAKVQSEYKFGFYTFLLNQFLAVGIWLIFWRVLLNSIGDFGAWGFSEMVMLTGFVSITSTGFFLFIQIWRLPTFIVSGQLNMYLIRPLHPFLHIMGLSINLRSLPRLLTGVVILIAGIFMFEGNTSALPLLISFATAAIAWCALLIPFCLLGLIAFWTGKAEFIRDLTAELFLFQNYPLSEFPRGVFLTFVTAFPIAFAGTIPVLMITTFSVMTSVLVFIGLVIIILVQMLVFATLWKRGLARYESWGG